MTVVTATAIRVNASFHSTHHALALGAGCPHGHWQAGSRAQRSGVACPEPGCRPAWRPRPSRARAARLLLPWESPSPVPAAPSGATASSPSWLTRPPSSPLHSQLPLQSPWGQAVASLPPEPRWCLPHGCFGPQGSRGSILTMARCQARAPYAVQVVQTDGNFSGS